ncbi:NAD kinase isoform X2 [Oryctolagus cuniculus]|uniref:NAD kinase isoform X2 n=1 Tax=Oryctolagus cuniculus TaxID=9986 RepID=UPI00387A1771
MEQENINGNKELSPDSTTYHCSVCHGDETWGHGLPIRGRTKSCSLSASPALGSTKEFRHIQDPASQQLTWNKPPKNVLVIKKIRYTRLLQLFKEFCVYLVQLLVRSGKAVEYGPHSWAPAPMWETWKNTLTPGSWLWIGPAPAIVAIYGVNQRMDDPCLFLCLTTSCSKP